MVAPAAGGEHQSFLAGWHLLIRPKRASKLSEILAYLVSGHAAGLIGTLRYLGGFERKRWKRVVPD